MRMKGVSSSVLICIVWVPQESARSCEPWSTRPLQYAVMALYKHNITLGLQNGFSIYVFWYFKKQVDKFSKCDEFVQMAKYSSTLFKSTNPKKS